MRKLTVIFAFLTLSAARLWAETQTVSYLYPVYNTGGDATSGIASWQIGSVNATVVTNSSNVLNTGWYVVLGEDVQTGSLVCQGAVHLILADGAKLTATGDLFDSEPGIQVSGEGNSLTIYGQTNQLGKLLAYGKRRAAGIGGESEQDGSNITINGGKIEAEGYAAGIGGGSDAAGYNIIINGGEVYATGNYGGAGIGGGNGDSEHATGGGVDSKLYRDGHDITINGGTVTANGFNGGAGIGGGNIGNGYNIAINGGTIMATAIGVGGYGAENKHGAGIGGGWKGVGHDITFTNGYTNAICESNGAPGIGNGSDAEGSATCIIAAKRCYVRAGNSSDPTNMIAHEDNTDLASQLDGNCYVTVIFDLIDSYNKGYAAGNDDGLQEGKADALGGLGLEQDGPAVDVTDQNGKTIRLYNPKKVNFIKVTDND